MTRLPNAGIACWPVGNGDAITLKAPDGLVVQLDINHLESDDNDWAPVVDLLADELDTVNHDGADKPELPVLMLSHHDEDHCRGITRMFSEFRVNELIVTLRCFVEAEELTELGEELVVEAERRRDAEVTAAAQGERARPGDRLQIVGYADILETDGWADFPPDLLTIPGNLIKLLDNDDHSEAIEVFVHSPFREDTENGDRNDSCLGVHVTMISDTSADRYLLLGDLKHRTIEAIFETSIANGNTDRLDWDVLVAPHHCSRNSVRAESDTGFTDAPAADFLDDHAADGAVVIVSSNGDYTGVATSGANPPHSDARTIYQRIVGKPNIHNTHDEAKGADSYPTVIEAGSNNSAPTAADRAKRLVATAAALGAPLAVGDQQIKGNDRKFA